MAKNILVPDLGAARGGNHSSLDHPRIPMIAAKINRGTAKFCHCDFLIHPKTVLKRIFGDNCHIFVFMIIFISLEKAVSISMHSMSPPSSRRNYGMLFRSFHTCGYLVFCCGTCQIS